MTSRSRPALAGAGILVIAVGVAATLKVPGLPGDLLGSACYTALLFVMAALALTRCSEAWASGGLAAQLPTGQNDRHVGAADMTKRPTSEK